MLGLDPKPGDPKAPHWVRSALVGLQSCSSIHWSPVVSIPVTSRAVFHLIRDGDLLAKLNRYETQLINQLARIAGKLEQQRARRKAPPQISELSKRENRPSPSPQA